MSYSFGEGIYNTYLYLANWGKTKVECDICGTRFYSFMSEELRLKSEAEGIKNYGCSEGCMMTIIARSEREKLSPEDRTDPVFVNCGECNKSILLCLSPNDLKISKTYFCDKHEQKPIEQIKNTD